MIYELPKTVEVGGREYEVRTDFRPVLDIIEALSDPELDDVERAEAMLSIFYFSPSWEEIPEENLQEAIDKCRWFIDCGDASTEKKGPTLMSWEQDFRYIVSPVNKIIGQDVRGIPYNPETNTGGLHWWTFMSAYMEIGDCLFSQIVSIRSKKAKGQKLDKSEQEFYRKNRELVDIKKTYTSAENDLLKEWTGT